ncbi:hypothetical protein EBS80_02190 [bacterium]|nr:hypothetical protein [bacterium]
MTAVIGDSGVTIYFPDGREDQIPHEGRSVAGLLLDGWVANRALAWSDGRQTTRPVSPDSGRRSNTPVSIGRIFDDAARLETRLFSLRPA